MSNIFPKWANKVPILLGICISVGVVLCIAFIWYYFSPKYTDVGYAPVQPVPFSHKLHAGDLGMDCRYCHNTVENAAQASIPPTETCMTCHSYVLPESAKLSPVRESFAKDTPIEWVRVHMLPDYAYFDHSIHVSAGVSCVSCHGRVDQMEVVTQNQPLSMGWCLECHRNPGPNLRPLDKVTDLGWDPKKAGYDPAKDPHRLRQVNPKVDCSTCHR